MPPCSLVLVSTLTKSDPHLVGVPRALSCHASLIGRDVTPSLTSSVSGWTMFQAIKKPRWLLPPRSDPLQQRLRGG